MISAQKRPRAAVREVSSTGSPPANKRAMHARIIQRWVAENNTTLNTSVWLEFERADCYHVFAWNITIIHGFKDRSLAGFFELFSEQEMLFSGE